MAKAIAMSLLIHGEAVRFNRGKNRDEGYDFKYMQGQDRNIYPYVSSQSFKRHWREALPFPPSPITHENKNQAYTDGDPIKYVDDDLFGYMIAGATKNDEEEADEDERIETPDEIDASKQSLLFIADSINQSQKIIEVMKKHKVFFEKFLESDFFQKLGNSDEDKIKEILTEALNTIMQGSSIYDENDLKEMKVKSTKPKTTDSMSSNREILLRILPKPSIKETKEKKRDTTRRTAPIRMHALVAFSGIKLAKDFQTFSRDISYTGNNSVLNPTTVGIYSGWLKSRILIEYDRLGKFYVGKNMDILKEQIEYHSLEGDIKKEINPYSRTKEEVQFIQLNEEECLKRLRASIKALADIGNNQGPASGALHDGSLRPKAFIAAMMNCADSPFDYVWKGTDLDPILDIPLLKSAIHDWDDLFANKKIYIGLPGSTIDTIKDLIISELQTIGFQAIIDTPRKALIKLSEEVVL